MRKPLSIVSAVIAALTLTACGGSEPAPAAPAAPPADTSTAAPPPPPVPTAQTSDPADAGAPVADAAPPAPLTWKDMNHDQRLDYMKTVVYPAMKTSFQELDAKHFAKFTCVTCHGEGAKEGNFDMPNPKLPKLDPANNFKKHMAKKAAMVTFMTQKVVPGMAQLLNEAPYDPATQKGFGCFDCHTMQK